MYEINIPVICIHYKGSYKVVGTACRGKPQSIPPADLAQWSCLRSPVLYEEASRVSAGCHNYRAATGTTTAGGISTDLPPSTLSDKHKTSCKVSIVHNT